MLWSACNGLMISACCSFNIPGTRHPLSTDIGSTGRSESRAWQWWIPTERCRICISRWWIPNYRWRIWKLKWGKLDPVGSPQFNPWIWLCLTHQLSLIRLIMRSSCEDTELRSVDLSPPFRGTAVSRSEGPPFEQRSAVKKTAMRKNSITLTLTLTKDRPIS